MYCSKCGKELPDEAKFCNICGQPTGDAAAVQAEDAEELEAESEAVEDKEAVKAEPDSSEGPETAEDGPEAVEDADMAQIGSSLPDERAVPGESGAVNQAIAGEKLARPQKKKGRGRVIGIAVAIVAIIAIVAGVVGYNMWKTDRDRHAIRYAQVTVSSELLTPEFSPIPFEVTGTDIDGNSVNQLIYPDMSTVSNGTVIVAIPLVPGEYEITIPAPIIGPGPGEEEPPVVILPPGDKPLPVIIDPDIRNDPPGATIEPSELWGPLVPIDDLTQLTDEQIALIREYAEKSGFDMDKLNAWIEKLVAARDAAIAEQKERERIAALKAKHHISTAHYELDLPEYWWDRVHWDIKGDNATTETLSVYDDQTGQLLLEAVFHPYNPNIGGWGDNPSHFYLASAVKSSDGGSLSISVPDYVLSYMTAGHSGCPAKTYSPGVSQDAAAHLVDMLSGGTVSASSYASKHDQVDKLAKKYAGWFDPYSSAYDWAKSNIASTLVVH